MTERRFAVAWTEVAARDVERLAERLFDESPLRAQAILDRVIGRADSLDRSPERGRRLRELRSIGDKTWREIQEPPWRIIYRIVEDRVEVHAVLDARRNLEDLLLERLLEP